MNPWILCLGVLGLTVFVAAVIVADNFPPPPAPDAPESEHAWYHFLQAHRELA